MSLVIHPASEKRLSAVMAMLPQSLLLTGERGVGLGTIARCIAGAELVHSIAPSKAGEHDAVSGTISVDAIRELHEYTRSKSNSRRIIIIDDADMMSDSAQASFLKLLEEPSSHTYFILTSHAPQQLLPTVLSRVQTSHIHEVTAEQTDGLLDTAGITDGKKRLQLHFIAKGKPAELHRLLDSDEYFAAQAAITADARDLLTKKTYEKLLLITKYQSDRSATMQLIDSAIAMARHNVSTTAQPQLITQLEKLIELREQIAGNANAKLQLTRFVL